MPAFRYAGYTCGCWRGLQLLLGRPRRRSRARRASVLIERLGRQQYRSTYGLRKLDGYEELPRVQIVLTRFVDYAELPVLLRYRVSD